MVNLATKGNGFGLVEAMLVTSVTLALLFAGWIVYERHHDTLLSSSSATQLTIQRKNTLDQPGIGNFTKRASHLSAVILMHDIKTAQAVPGGALYNCPNDDGVEYILQFSHPSLKATASATGCQMVMVNGREYFTTDAFWKDVSRATGQPVE
jgi:hypothetical protein